MWFCEDKAKGKTARFRLPSASGSKTRVLKVPIGMTPNSAIVYDQVFTVPKFGQVNMMWSAT